MNRKKTYKTPLAAIKAKCKECCCGVIEEVKQCTMKDCALWQYRLGKENTESKE